MKLDITLPVGKLKIHGYTKGSDIPSVTWVFNQTLREVLKECDVNGLNVEHSRSPGWRRPLAPLSSPRPGCWTGRSRPVRCDSVVSTTVCRPRSPASYSHVTPQHIWLQLCVSLCFNGFYLKDFILQHWQLVGIPCYKVVANFGIFAGGGHPVVRPVKKHVKLSWQFVFAFKGTEECVRDSITYPFEELEEWVP